MNSKPEELFGSRIRIKTRKPSGDEPPEQPRQPVAIGVPLTKLIKRRLVVTPDIVMLHQPRSVGAERFRRLRTVLVNLPDPPAQVVVVSGAAPGDGKTTVAINLALAFASDKKERVLLLDADLRRPSISSKLEPRPQLGLAEVLSGDAPLDHAVMRLQNSQLEILPATVGLEDPLDLLASAGTGDLIQTLRGRYSRIVIDTPPAVAFTDADALGAFADGVLLVARAGLTPSARYQQAVESLSSARLLGAVLNDSRFSLADWHRYGGDDYATYYRGKDAARTRDEDA